MNKELELELELALLPHEVKKDGKTYKLFIYPDMGGWCVEYALPRFYCDSGKGCADDEYCIYYGYTGKTLKETVEGVLLRLKRMESGKKL